MRLMAQTKRDRMSKNKTAANNHDWPSLVSSERVLMEKQ
jgi:hypothetical protein